MIRRPFQSIHRTRIKNPVGIPSSSPIFEFYTPPHLSSTVQQKIPTISIPSYYRRIRKRPYFTNTDQMKKDDPYAALGIQWGATTSDIKHAFQQKARQLHPDVNRMDTPKEALRKFQDIQKAYKKLMDVKGASHRDDLMEEWSFAVWRNGDLIAENRNDVAGVMRKRPIKPAESTKRNKQWGIASLGHPDGLGIRSSSRRKGGEYLEAGAAVRNTSLGNESTSSSRCSSDTTSNTVGNGQNKWVSKREFIPWNPKNNVKFKAYANHPIAPTNNDDNNDDDDTTTIPKRQ